MVDLNTFLPADADAHRGRRDSAYPRNLVHLGLATRGWPDRRDASEDREAVRTILIGLVLQSINRSTALSIRHGLCKAVALGTDEDRANVAALAARLTAWYEGLPDEDSTQRVDADAIVTGFDTLVSEIDTFADRFRGD